MYLRVIPRLDIKGPNLVKGIHLEGLRVLGKPERFARLYFQEGADELIYQDAVASLYGRNSLLDIVERTAREIFIPLTVGGGLRSLEDIRQVLRAGADKVSLNTAAVERPELIREAVQAFGSSTILVSVEAIRRPGGGWEAYTDYGRQSTGLDAVAWAQQAEELGAGELLVTSIDQEGTGKGYDLELTAGISRRVGIPVIALGGAGSPADVVAAVGRGGADAVSLASVLHYEALARVDSLAEDYSSEGNTTFLAAGGGRPRLEEASLAAVKQALAAAGVDCRPAELVA